MTIKGDMSRVKTVSDKLKKASEAHAGQSKELLQVFQGMMKRRKKMCNVVGSLLREERGKYISGKKPTRMTRTESLWNGLECESIK